MRVSIKFKFKKFDQKYEELVTFAILRMEDVLSSPIFLEMLSDEIARSKGLEGELSKWKRASILEIHAQLFPIELSLNTYYTSKSVIGYGLSSTKEIYVNTKYLSKYSVDRPEDLMEIGSNLLHEHSHDCGFDHDYDRTKRRYNSLSYIMNRAYERAFKKYYSKVEVKPILSTHYFTPWYHNLLPWNWF